MKKRIEVSLSKADDLIELEPYGVTTGAEQSRPVMLFRSAQGDTLPVWLSPIDAGIAVTQHHVKSPNLSPHDLTLKVLGELGVKLDSCVFTELKGHHQYVELQFSGSRKLKTISCRADQAISFCLQAQSRFFCRRGYIQDCRTLSAELVGIEKDLRLNPSVAKNRHPYLN